MDNNDENEKREFSRTHADSTTTVIGAKNEKLTPASKNPETIIEELSEIIDDEIDSRNSRDILIAEIKKLKNEQKNGQDFTREIDILQGELDETESDLRAMALDLGLDDFSLSKTVDEEEEEEEEEEYKSAITAIDKDNEETKEALQAARSWMIRAEEINSEGLDSIQGLSDVKTLLKTHIIAKQKLPNLFKGKSIQSIMLIGPPGTGKTLIAQAVAKDAGLNFFDVRAASLSSRYVNTGARQTNALFNVALENEPALIFIDEADALLGRRTEDGNKTRGITDTFMMALEDIKKLNKEVYVIAATNNPEDLDPAIIRRFKNVAIKLPGDKEREQLWRTNLISSGTKILDDVDYELLSELTQGYSGSDINSLVTQISKIRIEELVKDMSPKDYEFMSDMTIDDLGGIDMLDIEREISKYTSSVSKEDIDKLDEWWAKYR